MTFDLVEEDRPMGVASNPDLQSRDVHVIRIARDFSSAPGGRSPKNGPFSGEVFRETILLPALRNVPSIYSAVVVELDGTDTYIGSFLEEAFGGLLRGPYKRYADLKDKLHIKATGEFEVFKRLALQYIEEQDAINRR